MHAYQPERLSNHNRTTNPVLAILKQQPALFCGAALSLAVTGAVLTNAIWYQPGKHPSPMFSTRDVNVVRPLAENDAVKPKQQTAKKSVPAQVAALETSEELLREVQTALSVRGYYDGKLDGVYGSRTRSAINQFQRDHSFTADGKVSVRLLTQILMSASARPKEVPVPKRVVAEKTPKTDETKQQASAKAQPLEQVADGLVARIQSGLKAYGYDDLIVDGKMGQHTATAIQRFQLDYGMKITGEPSPGVLKKLKEIGAVDQG
ncbi:MAG: peptidoglycan-binding domain-containing protein [Pseudomonadota bacterium]